MLQLVHCSMTCLAVYRASRIDVLFMHVSVPSMSCSFVTILRLIVRSWLSVTVLDTVDRLGLWGDSAMRPIGNTTARLAVLILPGLFVERNQRMIDVLPLKCEFSMYATSC
jgi:hypothetical protein